MVRNRIRRRLRSVSREAGPLLRPGAYLVGAHAGASSLSYRELRATLCEALATLATKEPSPPPAGRRLAASLAADAAFRRRRPDSAPPGRADPGRLRSHPAYRALSANRLPHCRYSPTCSAYALEAIETHGVGRGLWLALGASPAATRGAVRVSTRSRPGASGSPADGWGLMLAAAYLDWLYNALGTVLAFFYGLIPSYGFAIIMLTITVRVLLIPLTAKQVKSQRAMQHLQPELKKLQAKYKGDRQKLNEEMMKLYKEHKANPLAGCLPLILQMPLFIVLYRIIIDLSKVPPQHIPIGSELYRALVESGGQARSPSGSTWPRSRNRCSGLVHGGGGGGHRLLPAEADDGADVEGRHQPANADGHQDLPRRSSG